MVWWIWLLGGLVLLLVELITPGGFFFLFFGVGAIAVGALSGLGVGPDWLLLLIFSVLSIGSLLLFRGPLLRRLRADEKTGHAVDSIVGVSVLLTEDLAASGQGKAELRGTVWNVQNAGDAALTKGARCRVERIDGLKLIVRAE